MTPTSRYCFLLIACPVLSAALVLPRLIDTFIRIPGEARQHFNNATALEKSGDRDGALAAYAQALALNPHDDVSFAARGTIYNKSGQWDRALIEYSKSIAINPRNSRVFNNRAIVYSALGNRELALKDFNEAVRLDDKYGEAYFNRSIWYWHGKEYIKAMDDVLKASELGVLVPDHYYMELKAMTAQK